jgi:hypothetical protein
MLFVSGRLRKKETGRSDSPRKGTGGACPGPAACIRKKSMTLGLLLGLLVFSQQGKADEAAVSEGAGGELPRTMKRAHHMEFDERLIMGQSLKSGALYLFERKDSEIQTMLKIRRDYRQELLAPLEPLP